MWIGLIVEACKLKVLIIHMTEVTLKDILSV